MKTKKIPARALRFDASLELGQMAADGEVEKKDGSPATVPVTLKARSGGIVNHWWFGRAVHDFAGMKPVADKLPLDYCHFCDEVIGFSDKQDTSSGDLIMSGQLVPFTAEDRASEVIHKGKAGVPYQASIYFDPEALVIEEVAAGMKASANGQEFDGPVTIFRQWQLRGAAVCPYGMDANTNVKFAASDDREIEINLVGEMTAEAPAEEPAPADVATEVPANANGEKVTEQSTEPTTETAEPVAEVKPDETAPATELATDPEPEAPAGATELSNTPATKVEAPNGRQFLEAFGDIGGRWFAEGKSFDEARTLFTKNLVNEVTELKKKNAEQAALLAANRGEQAPLTFTPAEETVAPTERKLNSLPDGMAKFASSIKIRRG